jgi:hypothetical protein
MSHLERIADRQEAGGIAESILAQLDLGEPIDHENAVEMLRKVSEQVVHMLDQALYLEQGISTYQACLNSEKRVNLDIKLEMRKLQEENASLSKENRHLKGNIEEFFAKDK